MAGYKSCRAAGHPSVIVEIKRHQSTRSGSETPIEPPAIHHALNADLTVFVDNIEGRRPENKILLGWSRRD
jgi:hypothetical protein